MTSENSFSIDQFKQQLESYKEAELSKFSGYLELPEIPTDIRDLLAARDNANTKITELNAISISPLSVDYTSDVIAKYDELDQTQANRKSALESQAQAEISAAESEHEREVAEVQQYNADLILPMKKKHEELLKYKNQLEYVWKHYDITPLDTEVSDNLTLDEFSGLIDQAIQVCSKYINKSTRGIINQLLNLVRDSSNILTMSFILILLIVVTYLILPVLAVPAFGYMFYSIHNLYQDLDKLRLARALMAQIDYQRFVPEESYRTVDELDTSDISEKYQAEIENLHDYTNDRKEALQAIEDQMPDINNAIMVTTEDLQNQLDAVRVNWQQFLAATQNAIIEFMSDYHSFPYEQSTSVVMKHNYVLGRLEDTIDVTAQLPLLNIVFNSDNRPVAINLMKLYLANALLSVRVKQLTIEIFDPKNMCEDFTEFFTPETKPYIKPNNLPLDKLMDTYRKYSQENVIALDKRPIDDFNKDAEERELVPKEYKLLLLISETKKLHEGDQKTLFEEYNKFSASTGVMIWLLDDQKWPNTVWVDGSYDMEGSPIQYDQSIGRKAVEIFSKSLANYKDTGIDYVSKFGDVFIPREKWWTFDTIKGIKMPYGLENGDPTRGLNVAPEIGDANVHALLGGATGAGKSAAINQLLISLITMYPPSELQIVYIDFKNVEAAKFTAGYDRTKGCWMPKNEEEDLRQSGAYYTRLSRIPHLRIISGTTDGEYALSVFEFLMGEMARRQQIINKFGVTKVEEMRKQILAKYNEEHNGDKKKGSWADMRRDWDWYKPNVYDKYGDLPRLLVIFDEFQVMYNPEFVDNRIIDQINGKITAITKLARAMGSHFWFTSQSMKGTMSKDTMGNFSLRGALRCTDEVSDELLGNKAASTIKAKFGFMYTNDSAGTDKDKNRLWRVPFLDEKAMPDYIDPLNDMLTEFNEQHDMAEFYDEKILVPSSILDEWYENYHDTFADPNIFILGERANFSTNKAPVAISLQEDGGENVMIAAFDRNDMLNLTMTMIKNLQMSDGDASIIINCQDVETHTLMDVESIVPEAFLSLSYPKQDIPQLIDAFSSMVEKREDTGPPYRPVYIFCIQWERAPGISADVNYRLGDKFKDILRRAPNVGIHFIFASREKLDMQRYIPAACNHRICGLLPKDAAFFCETTKVEKLPDASKDAGLFAFYEFGTTLNKFRIYQHTYTKVIKSREIVL